MKSACLPRSLSVNRELTVLCQYAEFQKQGVKINTEENHTETCKLIPRSLSVSHKVSMNLH